MTQTRANHWMDTCEKLTILAMYVCTENSKHCFSIEQCFEKILNFSKYFFSILFQFNFVDSKHCSYGSFIYPMVHSYECISGTMFWINIEWIKLEQYFETMLAKHVMFWDSLLFLEKTMFWIFWIFWSILKSIKKTDGIQAKN